MPLFASASFFSSSIFDAPPLHLPIERLLSVDRQEEVGQRLFSLRLLRLAMPLGRAARPIAGLRLVVEEQRARDKHHGRNAHCACSPCSSSPVVVAPLSLSLSFSTARFRGIVFFSFLTIGENETPARADSVSVSEIQTLGADRHLKCGSSICVERAKCAWQGEGVMPTFTFCRARKKKKKKQQPSALSFSLFLQPPPPHFFPLSFFLAPLCPLPPTARSVAVRAAAVTPRTDPSQRIVVTGMGIASCFGNDVDTFYDKLLSGTSAVGAIDRFDASEFPTNVAAQIRNFDNEG